MEKARKKMILVAFILIAASAFTIVAAQEGWFLFIENLSGLDESDRRMVDTFILTELPEFFTAGVFIEGSGYIGQTHTVDISISHDRPDDSVNIADGSYSLDLELNEVVKETITSGSFTGLRKTAPFIAPSYSWTPSSPADTYNIVLSLRNIVWALLPEYTITSSAGAGGSIDPLGAITLLQGDDQTFTITADPGYEIDEILVNEAYIMSFDPYVFNYPFINVTNDWTIHATFSELNAIFSNDNVALEFNPEVTFEGTNMTLETTLFNGNLTHEYAEGEAVNYNISLVDIENTLGKTIIYWHIYYEFLDGTNRTNVGYYSDVAFNNWPPTHNIIGTFTAPDYGVYRLVLYISDIQ